MRKYLLPDKGNFYKANLHIHSTVSDGQMTPEELKKIYMEKGYSIIAFTDHEVMVPQTHLSDENFLAITSTEIGINDRTDCDFNFAKTYHLNIYSPEENRSAFAGFDKSNMWLEHSYAYITPEQEAKAYDRRYDISSVNEVIKMANDEGCLVSYNHPVWSMQNYSDYSGLEGLWGIELYNTGCARNGYIDSTMPYDDLLKQGKRIFPLATDDSHRLFDCFGGYVMIRAENLEYKTIFDALRRGDFYASTGPSFEEISIEDGVVRVKCSPVKYVNLSTDTRLLFSKNQMELDAPITETELDIRWYFDLSKSEINEHKYIRLTLIDEQGNAAYSRAYFIDELSI